jgi:hypothetical protein
MRIHPYLLSRRYQTWLYVTWMNEQGIAPEDHWKL